MSESSFRDTLLHLGNIRSSRKAVHDVNFWNNSRCGRLWEIFHHVHRANATPSNSAWNGEHELPKEGGSGLAQAKLVSNFKGIGCILNILRHVES